MIKESFFFKVTNKIYNLTTTITEYKICPDLHIDFSQIGYQSVKIDGIGSFVIQVIDSVNDYVEYMEEIFDFEKVILFNYNKKIFFFFKIKAYISGEINGRPLKLLIDSMHGVTGPYVSTIFVDKLGANPSSCFRTIPKPDFGGCHPDPNLTYAKDLVMKMQKGEHDIGVAFDGDGVSFI